MNSSILISFNISPPKAEAADKDASQSYFL